MNLNVLNDTYIVNMMNYYVFTVLHPCDLEENWLETSLKVIVLPIKSNCKNKCLLVWYFFYVMLNYLNTFVATVHIYHILCFWRHTYIELAPESVQCQWGPLGLCLNRCTASGDPGPLEAGQLVMAAPKHRWDECYVFVLFNMCHCNSVHSSYTK